MKTDETFERELQLMILEMRKPHPDEEKILKLFHGDKYNIPINEYNRR